MGPYLVKWFRCYPNPLTDSMNDDDDQPLTLRRALRMPEFWLLLVAGIAAASGVSAWIVMPATVVGLSISSLPKYFALWSRAVAAGVERAWWMTVALSMLNNLGAAAAAFVLGVVAKWFWFDAF